MEYAAVTGIGSVIQPGIGDWTQLNRQPPATAADISVAATNLGLSAGSDIRGTKHTKNNINTVPQQLTSQTTIPPFNADSVHCRQIQWIE